MLQSTSCIFFVFFYEKISSSVLICRKVSNGYVPTTRQIRFSLDRVVADGTYTLRIALAAAQMSRLQVQIPAAD